MTDERDEVRVPLPPSDALCETCLRTDDFTARLPGGGIITYCRHSGFGAVWEPASGRWMLTGPFAGVDAWTQYVTTQTMLLAGAGATAGGGGPLH
ncbi:MAG: hypothetical protein ACODAC_10995 [Pseudomonadota bacterium]